MLDNVKGNCRCECDVIDDALIHPQKTKANHQLNYSRLKSILIRIISIVCVILGALSIVLQVKEDSCLFKCILYSNVSCICSIHHLMY